MKMGASRAEKAIEGGFIGLGRSQQVTNRLLEGILLIFRTCCWEDITRLSMLDITGLSMFWSRACVSFVTP